MEAYDISNTSGFQSVGSMVVFDFLGYPYIGSFAFPDCKDTATWKFTQTLGKDVGTNTVATEEWANGAIADAVGGIEPGFRLTQNTPYGRLGALQQQGPTPNDDEGEYPPFIWDTLFGVPWINKPTTYWLPQPTTIADYYEIYLASQDYVQQQVGLKASRTDISNAVTPVSNKVETTAAIVDSWEGYWGATNVELQVTNYYGNTTGALPRLRIREFRDGHWTNVWDEVDKFLVCKAEILHDVAQSNETVLAAVEAKYAPKAGGSHTDKGTTNVIPNSVYMTSPETYFGGGTEFQRVAVGSGAVSVLVDRGALAKTTGEPGTFRFQDAGGTNYFGFVKSDSYTIGCRTDGISVGAGNAITLRYDVIMAGEDVPVVYWKQQLESATPWAQLNNPDGTAADGAPYSVTWLQDGGSYYATVNCGGSPSGFFVAETSVAGDVVWETNMKARLGGGIECTNTATHVNGVIRAKYNGSTVTWEWSAR